MATQRRSSRRRGSSSRASDSSSSKRSRSGSSGSYHGTGLRPSASDPGGTALCIQQRGIRANEYVERQEAPAFDDVWHDLGRSCSRLKQDPDVDDPWNAHFERVWSFSYEDEEAFDGALFQSMSAVFKTTRCGISSSDYVVLWLSDDKLKAIALAQQVTKKKLNLDNFPGIPSESSRNDHSCVVLERTDVSQEWRITQCCSSIEIKMLDTILKPPVVEEEFIVQPSVSKSNAPIGQAIAYASSHVWPCLTRMGIEVHDVSLVSIAGDRTTQKGALGVRWLNGRYVPPKDCGGVFEYEIDGFGEVNNGDSDCKDAMAVYLSAILKGVKLAQKWVRNTTTSPTPLSGLALNISGDDGAADINSNFTCISTAAQRDNGGNIAANQGDFWEGTASTGAVLHCVSKRQNHLVNVNAPSDEADIPVLVKLSSTSVHYMLIACTASFDAIKILADKQLLQTPYIAAARFDECVLTVMEDLRVTHEEFCPKDLVLAGRFSLLDMWSAFKLLVEELLLPAAGHGVIHADIRAGYPMTYNILSSKQQPLNLKLVDLESLIQVRNWKPPSTQSYIRIYNNAVSFLFMQTLILGLAWQNEWEDPVHARKCCLAAASIGFTQIVVCPSDAVERLLLLFTSRFGSRSPLPRIAKGSPLDGLRDFLAKKNKRKTADDITLCVRAVFFEMGLIEAEHAQPDQT